MNIKSVACGVVFLLCVVMGREAQAELYGQIYGTVTAKDVVTGSGGLTNQITLTVNTNDGNSWLIICRRADANLGWCNPVPVNASVYAETNILPFTGVSGNTGWLSPTLLQWMPN